MEFSTSGSGGAEDNSTLTCAASSLQAANGTLLPTVLATGVRVTQTLYGLLILILGSFLNALIIILIVKYRKLRNVTFSIALQISFGNLIRTCAIGIPMIVNNIAGYWALGYIPCIISALFVEIFSSLRTLLIFVFFLDIFFKVFAPFLYRQYIYRTALAICAFSWCLSFGLGFILLPGILDCFIFIEPTLLCVTTSACNSCIIYFIITVSVCFIPSSIVPVVLLVPVYIKGRKYRKQTQQTQQTTTTSVLADEWRALKTFFYLFVAFILVSILPLIVISLAKHFFGDVATNLAIIASSNIWSFSVIWDAFIILRNKNIQEVLTKLKEKIIKACCRKELRIASTGPDTESRMIRRKTEIYSNSSL